MGIGTKVILTYDEGDASLAARLHELQRLGVPVPCDCGCVYLAAQRHGLLAKHALFGSTSLATVAIGCARCGQTRLYTMKVTHGPDGA